MAIYYNAEISNWPLNINILSETVGFELERLPPHDIVNVGYGIQ